MITLREKRARKDFSNNVAADCCNGEEEAQATHSSGTRLEDCFLGHNGSFLHFLATLDSR